VLGGASPSSPQGQRPARVGALRRRLLLGVAAGWPTVRDDALGDRRALAAASSPRPGLRPLLHPALFRQTLVGELNRQVRLHRAVARRWRRPSPTHARAGGGAGAPLAFRAAARRSEVPCVAAAEAATERSPTPTAAPGPSRSKLLSEDGASCFQPHRASVYACRPGSELWRAGTWTWLAARRADAAADQLAVTLGR
jgi:hypothetical protein